MKTKRTSFLTGAAVTLTLTARRAAMTLLLAVLTAATAWAENVSLTQDGSEWYVNMPKTGTNTLTLSNATVTTFKVYDDGGTGDGTITHTGIYRGNYSDNCSGYLILTAPTGYKLQLSGYIKTEKNKDKLTVYNGSTTSATKLLNEVSSTDNGYQTAIPTVTSTGQSMMLYFHSDGSVGYAGLDLTVTLINTNAPHGITVSDATGGTVTSNKSSAKVNETVTLTATPASGYLLSDLSVKDANNKVVKVTWNEWSNSATFTMPASAVTVTPTFTNTLTADGGLFVNMPKTGTKTVTIPAGVQSFNVYDDGGSAGRYSNNCSGYLILTAPTGYVLRLSGKISTESMATNNDNLTVYDGSTTSGTRLLNEVSSTYNGTLAAITTVTSTGQSMMLYFESNGSDVYTGLDLTVTLINTNTLHGITVNDATGGTVTSNKSSAKFNETVTLTASSESGYMFNDLSVKDANNNVVKVTWNAFENTATFTMPPLAVTVTPTFTNAKTADGGLYINMPKEDSKSASIPAGVQSFKVYDDGGASGNYSNSCSGTLVLTAPTGYVLQLSGNIRTEINNDKLTVYNGSTTSATKLLNEVSSTYNGYQTAITTVTSTGQSMMLYFESNGSVGYAGYAGLDLTVTLVSTSTEYDINGLGDVTGGTIAASVGGESASKAKVHDVVTLTATPSEGYLLNSLSVTDANSNAVAVTDMLWYTGKNTATFTMLTSAVTVTPTFTNAKTADSGLYINMPKTGTKTATIPASVQSFKVYDDGGSAGKYSNNCNGYLTLIAPEGYVLQLSGNIRTEINNDKLTVYNGSTTSATKLLNEVSSNTQTAITTVVSTGQSMMLHFESNGSVGYAGLDLTVTLITTLELANDADNTDAISGKNGQTITALTLADRTLYKNGDWNTLCLPFALTAEQIAASPLAGFTIKELDGSTSSLDNTGKLTLNFTDATAIEAGKPYIVKWNPAAYITSTPIFNPADDVVTALNFISDKPTFDSGQESNWNKTNEGPAKLVDGNTSTKYGLTGTPWVEFHYASAITPKGYALWTANDEEGKRNPSSWTIKAKNDGDDDWTDLVEVNNEYGDKLPMANNQRTVFALNNSTAYQYFRFEATPASNSTNNGQFQLAELQFCTVQPSVPTVTPANITDPVFNNVTIDNSTEAQAKMTATSNDGNVKFVGTYSPFATTDGLLLDAHNTANGAFHAALSATCDGYTIGGWYTDAGKTTAATTIPFAADGSATLYVKWTENATVTRGDANGDGKITVTDIAVVVNYILQLTNTEFYLTGADANGDGYVTVTDIGVIVDIILGNNVDGQRSKVEGLRSIEPQ